MGNRYQCGWLVVYGSELVLHTAITGMTEDVSRLALRRFSPTDAVDLPIVISCSVPPLPYVDYHLTK